MSDRTKKKAVTSPKETAHKANKTSAHYASMGDMVKPSRLVRKAKRTWKRGEK